MARGSGVVLERLRKIAVDLDHVQGPGARQQGPCLLYTSLAAVRIEGMMKLGGESRQRIAPVERKRGGCVEFGMFQVGAAITVPHAPQVRCSTLEKKREKIAGSSVSILPTATRSRYS